MRAVNKCHLQSLAETLELSLIGGVLASGIDSFWVVCDILSNGLSLHYILILTVLVLATILMTIALIKHHNNNVKNQIHTLLLLKRNICKSKNRHNKSKTHVGGSKKNDNTNHIGSYSLSYK